MPPTTPSARVALVLFLYRLQRASQLLERRGATSLPASRPSSTSLNSSRDTAATHPTVVGALHPRPALTRAQKPPPSSVVRCASARASSSRTAKPNLRRFDGGSSPQWRRLRRRQQFELRATFLVISAPSPHRSRAASPASCVKCARPVTEFFAASVKAPHVLSRFMSGGAPDASGTSPHPHLTCAPAAQCPGRLEITHP